MDNKFIKPGYKPNSFPCDYCKYGALNKDNEDYKPCDKDCTEYDKFYGVKNEK